jgi:16S rRNA (guanine527-N7)-methyltransferase
MTPDDFLSALAAAGFQLTETQTGQFATYFELLSEWNEKINLTAITVRDDVYLKHFYDSLAPVLHRLIRPSDEIKLLDIGAGAGFPSLPMKILCPALDVTIIDALQKRLNFLSALTEKLQLKDVNLLHGRAEDFGQMPTYRAQFDAVTARAVARLNSLSELTLPFLKKEGYLYALKAAKFDEELLEAGAAITTLGGKLEKQVAYQLPDGAERHIAVIKKEKESPARFPRKAGQATKKPL